MRFKRTKRQHASFGGVQTTNSQSPCSVLPVDVQPSVSFTPQVDTPCVHGCCRLVLRVPRRAAVDGRVGHGVGIRRRPGGLASMVGISCDQGPIALLGAPERRVRLDAMLQWTVSLHFDFSGRRCADSVLDLMVVVCPPRRSDLAREAFLRSNGTVTSMRVASLKSSSPSLCRNT